MFQHRSSFAVPFTSFFLTEDDGKNPPVPPVKPEKPQFDETQQKHINDLLAAERKNAEERTEQRVRDEQAAKDREAEEKRQRDEQAKRGEFDEIRKELEGKLTAADSEKQTLTQKVEKYEAIAKKQVEALKGDLPGEATEDFPAEADPVTQLEWLESRKALIAKLAPATQQNQHPRVPATPKPQGRANPTEQQMADDMRGRISI